MSDFLWPRGLQHPRPPCPSPAPGVYSNTCPLSQCLITSWQIEEGKVEVVTEFLFLGSKITADGDWSHEIRRHLLLGRKAMTNLDSVLKSRDITLQTKVCIVKAMVLPVVIYGCEIWTVKKTECGRIDAFKLWCWRRLLRVLWTARRSNQSILREINPEYLLEGLMLKLKLQRFGHLMRRADSLEKTLMLGKTEGRRRGGKTEDKMAGWHHWHNGHELGQTSGDGEGQWGLACFSTWGHKESDRTGKLNDDKTETHSNRFQTLSVTEWWKKNVLVSR